MYPCAVNGDGILYGEVHEYPDYMRDILDRIEGVPHLYVREEREVHTTSGVEQVEMYFYNGSIEGLAKIESGVYNVR
jgi:gamma-glutamylcyclotransferase (GGCT)/AIG2-like uncharacterized protein YtfP